MATPLVAAKTSFKNRAENSLQSYTGDPFQLYFKIVEASQIEGRRDKTAKFNIKFWLETVEGDMVAGSCGKTRTHTGTPQITWNEEWVMPRIPGDQHKFRLHFVLYECFSLRPNASIGECIYDVDLNTTDGVCEIVLDLLPTNTFTSTTKGKSTEITATTKLCGKIKILCHKQPLYELPEERDKRRNEVEKRSVRLPSLRIVLEKASYYPGEMVRGLVICNITRPMNKPSLGLKFAGETTIHWRDIDDIEYDSHMSHLSYFMDSIGDDAQGENGDQLCFPFSFPLPDHIPPSFVGTQGSTRYRLSTFLEGAKNSEQSQTTYIEVLARYRPSIPTTYALGQSNTTNSPEKAVKLSIAVPSLVETGSQLPIRFSINNTANAKKAIYSVYACFIQDVFYHGKSTSQIWKMTSSQTKVTTVTMNNPTTKSENGDVDAILPILPGQQREITLDLEIPALTPPTVLEHMNPLMTVQYRVEGACLSEGDIKDATKTSVEVPLIVSRRAAQPPRSHNPPASMLQTLPARVHGDHAIRTNGGLLENTCSPRHYQVGIDIHSAKLSDFPLSTLPAIETSPRGKVGQPSSSTHPASFSISPSQRVFTLHENANAAEILPQVKATGVQNRQNCIILSAQSFNPISSKNSTLAILNDAPTTLYIDPRLVSLRRSLYGRSVPDPLKNFEPQLRIQKVVLAEGSTSETHLQLALQKAMAENDKTKYESSTVGTVHGASISDKSASPTANGNDLSMIVYCSSQTCPSFEDFFPPRPLCAWSDDIPITALVLPDYASLGVLKISNSNQGRQTKK